MSPGGRLLWEVVKKVLKLPTPLAIDWRAWREVAMTVMPLPVTAPPGLLHHQHGRGEGEGKRLGW
jgi:hypothetical protein